MARTGAPRIARCEQKVWRRICTPGLTFARRAARRSIPCTTFCVSGFTTCSNVAIDLSHFYFQMGAPNIPLPEALIFKVLTAPALFVTSGEMRNAVSEDYDWTQLATA